MAQKQQNYSFALSVMFIVSFLLGFITTMNNSMINFCKWAFELDQMQGQLVNTAFYGAYVLSIPLAILMNKLGYKRTLVLGLFVIAFGFILNYFTIGIFAGTDKIYWAFLSCMFVVAIGIVFLQLVMNPYVKALGTVETAASRMTLNQSLNSLATTLAPMFVSILIVSNNKSAGLPPTTEDALGIQNPFVFLGLFTLVLGGILLMLKLPSIKEEEQVASDGKAQQFHKSIFKYPHIFLGALGIFCYMGVEIGIPSFLPQRMEGLGLTSAIMIPGFISDFFTLLGMNMNEATSILVLYWFGMLVGRACGSFVLGKYDSKKVLLAALAISALCVALSLLTTGAIAIWLLILTGLFHSIMWPCIFNLGLEELGPHTKAASGIINTGVIGAALLMPMMGQIEKTAGLTVVFCCLFVYYAYIMWFTVKGSQIRLK
ncbi:MAG: glucose/galactose MFS transporter [Bacteroidales bacterium]|nr:glucose/galactose MFS transporter [Bacteroidales bacterium]MDD3160459.1 glucose/galactose MFS transporter [Bacteroidales bacterium]